MEYSKDNVMTRKEYLKSKKKHNFFLSKLKYVLLVLVVVLLGAYVFKQLNVYNNVTKIANKVVEETKLAKTMKMYFVSEPYTKDGMKTVALYKSNDESRTMIPGTEGFTSIQVVDNKLYGLCDKKLYAIDLTDNAKIELTNKNIEEYVVTGTNIYLRLNDGIYSLDLLSNEIKKIIAGKTYKLLVDVSNIYVITDGKTSKSIVKYNLSGEKDKELTEKYSVSNMYLENNNIYFINAKDSKIYSVSKSGGEVNKITDKKTITKNGIVCYKDSLYYINKDDSNTLYEVNLKTGKQERVIKKDIESVQIDGSNIYYKLSNAIGIYKYDIQTKNTSQVTSARTTEYICIN